MVKIMIHGDYVDFEAPICMTDEQREKFISFLKKTLNEKIEIKEVEEITHEMGNREMDIKKWGEGDYILLFKIDDDDILAQKMKRTSWAISLKKGEFMPEFFEWAKNKGYDLPPTKMMIRKFLNER